MMQSSEDMLEGTLGIGAISRATGIPSETLRTWERRYGFPRPERTGGGHRKYRASIVPHLKLIGEAISRGHRPLNVVGESVESLLRLLDMVSEPAHEDLPLFASGNHAPVLSPELAASVVEEWVSATLRLDREALTQGFTSAWYRLGPQACLIQLFSPFLNAVGQAWFEGRLAVLHEQFASNELRQFLSHHWRSWSERSERREILCTTLPGEYHSLGLHMVSVLVAMAGFRVVFLGMDTPVQTIANAAKQYDVRHVLVSVSIAAHAPVARRHLEALRGLVTNDVAIVVGGAGAPSGVEGIMSLGGLDALSEWVQSLSASLS